MDRWTENKELAGWLQTNVAVNSSMSRWRPKINGVSQGTVLRPAQFNVCVTNMHGGINSTLSIFTDNTKLCGVVKMLEERRTILRNLDRFESWVHVNFMKFSEAKCKCRVGYK